MKQQPLLCLAIYGIWLLVCLHPCKTLAQENSALQINDDAYFELPGLNVMVYHDYYPGGHQSGITIIQNGTRIAANGDVRLAPIQRPYPEHGERMVDRANNEISVKVWYADSLRKKYQDQRYPYPDIDINCTVRVKAEGSAIRISVDLDKPLPEAWQGKVGFSMELFPGHFFDQTYYVDDVPGIFPHQLNGPVSYNEEKEIEVQPMARGKKLVIMPEFKDQMIAFESLQGDLELMDGRSIQNHGWFIVRSPLRTGVVKNAAEWMVRPGFEPDYTYDPVIHVSQVGYRTQQKKVAVIELDKQENDLQDVTLLRVSENGGFEVMKTAKPEMWGKFLRYQYARFDFTDIEKPGMYRLKYGDTIISHPFQIQDAVFKRHVWQPTLEYFLPVQMCHMRVNDRYKVWHGLCHDDDALMAPVSHVHFDGYHQGPSTLTKFKPYDPVPGLNVGGWHDAGDYDLRVESQANTVRMLSYSRELFDVTYDETTVDEVHKLVEMHRPDGQPDILQQIQHGALTIVAAYKAMGRLYRGIICQDGRQYSLLGDGSTMTDNLFYDASLGPEEKSVGHSGRNDDRLVFTEENPPRELFVAACLATAYRSLHGYRDTLANDCLTIARKLWDLHKASKQLGLIDAAAELYLSTGDEQYLTYILSQKDQVTANIDKTGPAIARIASKIDDNTFMTAVRNALQAYASQVDTEVRATPFAVRYKPDIWGAGWDIQQFGVDQYFLHQGFPDIFAADPVFNALNFVLGVHPGTNTASFISGVGAQSLLVAYGFNRDDWSYIPGGSASGTALIRPDLPELKTWPYFWQQTEYVMGGGATNYMFLVLAADDLLNREE